MDTPNQPPVMPQPQQPAAAPRTPAPMGQTPIESGHRSKLIFSIGVVVLLVAVGIYGWQKLRVLKVEPSSGFTDRSLPSVTKINQAVSFDGSCITEYQLLTGGRGADGQQHYVLSIGLKSNPADEAALAVTLASDSCKEELTTIKQSIAPSINADTTPNILTMSFVAASGTRLQLP